MREYLFWGSTSVVAFAGQATLVMFFVFFLLATGDLFKRKLVKIAGPSLAKKRITVQILDEIFWSFVWGLWGTLLAVPMLAVVKAFCDRIEDLNPVGELLGEWPPAPP